MPLLVGLVDSAARRSLDISLPLHGNGSSQESHVDLDELAAKRVAGGNLLDSIANMANSILGAGAARSNTVSRLIYNTSHQI